MKDNDPKEWMKEYSEFLNIERVQVPHVLSRKTTSHIQALLNPSAWTVFVKLLGIHSVVGFLSLGICHQFGMNPFGTTSSLSDWFMEMWGHTICMVGCGILFVGLSIFAAGYFLTIEEVRALRRTEFLQTLALGVFSLLIFSIFGTELASTFTRLWLIGAVIGGFAATETVWKLKTV